MAIYKWKVGSRVNANAQAAGEQCERMARAGNLTPAALVKANKSKNAPLHDYFEWDNNIAADKYRESQAAYIIRSIEVDITGATEPTRAFVSLDVSESSHREYMSIETVLCDKNSRDELLRMAKLEMLSFKRKYAELAELAQVFEAMDAIVA